MTTYEQIAIANSTIKCMDIKNKQYAPVSERIKAFRMVYPDGLILTEMLSDENGKCIFKASVYKSDRMQLIGVGHAYEREENGMVNRTSYVENCETSAVGRALAMCGFGIDVSIASYEEMETALASQPINSVTLRALRSMLKDEGIREDTILRLYKLKKLEDISDVKHRNIHENIENIRKDQEAHDEGQASPDVSEH